MVCLRLAGWNDDRRETCDIPEAAKYVRLWGQLVGFDESMSPSPPLLRSRQALLKSRRRISGAWSSAAPLPIPRSEMAWATAEDDRMHVIGGYDLPQHPLLILSAPRRR